MDLSLYTSKHEIIKASLNTIEKLVKDGTKKNAAAISGDLNRLSAVVKMHLSSEDKFFYPELLKSEDPKVRSIAKFYMDEMIGLAKSFTDFVTRFYIPSEIEKEEKDFEATFATVSYALRRRMESEEESLYPLSL